MRVASSEGLLHWQLTDHPSAPLRAGLGSTSVTYSADGLTREADWRYYPFGLGRYTWGDPHTVYRYTGQREEDDLDFYHYGARWYDPVVGRFGSPDSIVPDPGDPQSLNRYSYVLNQPLGYVDPDGHDPLRWYLAGLGGAAANYAGQAAVNVARGDSVREALITHIDTGAALRAGIEGAKWQAVGETVAAVVGGVYLGGATLAAAVGGTGTAALTKAAQAACADGDCTNEVRKAGEQGFAVIGKTQDPNYGEVARKVGGDFFQLADDVWDALTSSQQWEQNLRFLDEAIAQGKEFLLTHDYNRWIRADPRTSTYTKELQHLIKQGYHLIEREGQQWLVPPAQ